MGQCIGGDCACQLGWLSVAVPKEKTCYDDNNAQHAYALASAPH